MQGCSLSAFSWMVEREEPRKVLNQLEHVQRKFSGQLKYYRTHTLQLERCILLCMCMYMMVPAHDVCGIKGQRGNQSSPSTRWVPGTELRMSGLMQVLLPTEMPQRSPKYASAMIHTLPFYSCSSDALLKQRYNALHVNRSMQQHLRSLNGPHKSGSCSHREKRPLNRTLRELHSEGRSYQRKSWLKCGVTFLPAVEEGLLHSTHHPSEL